MAKYVEKAIAVGRQDTLPDGREGILLYFGNADAKEPITKSMREWVSQADWREKNSREVFNNDFFQNTFHEVTLVNSLSDRINNKVFKVTLKQKHSETLFIYEMQARDILCNLLSTNCIEGKFEGDFVILNDVGQKRLISVNSEEFRQAKQENEKPNYEKLLGSYETPYGTLTNVSLTKKGNLKKIPPKELIVGNFYTNKNIVEQHIKKGIDKPLEKINELYLGKFYHKQTKEPYFLFLNIENEGSYSKFPLNLYSKDIDENNIPNGFPVILYKTISNYEIFYKITVKKEDKLDYVAESIPKEIPEEFKQAVDKINNYFTKK